MSVSQSTHYSLTHSTTPSQSTSPLTQTSPQSRVHAHTHTHTHLPSTNTAHPSAHTQSSSSSHSRTTTTTITPKHPSTTNHPLKHQSLSQLSLSARQTSSVIQTPITSLTHSTVPSQTSHQPLIATPHQPTHPVILTNHSHSLHAYTHTFVYQTSPTVAG